MNIVLAFGTFDHFHPGHAAYLKQASSLGDYLIVVVARDVNVQKIKNKKARQTEEQRKDEIEKQIKKFDIKGKAVLGFKGRRLSVLKKYKPDIIALGYDQQVDEHILYEELKSLNLKTKIKRLNSYYPEKYKSSLMR